MPKAAPSLSEISSSRVTRRSLVGRAGLVAAVAVLPAAVGTARERPSDPVAAIRELSNPDYRLVELNAKRQQSKAAIDASLVHGLSEEEFNDLCSIEADITGELIRTPAVTLQGLLIKAHVAVDMAVTNIKANERALASPDSAYREVLAEDADYYVLDADVALITIWADLERIVGGAA